MTMGDWLSFSPDSTTRGAWVLLCYDFSQGATSPVTITITRDGVDNYDEVLDDDNPCVQVHVPETCTGLLAVDQSAQSTDAACSVST